MAPRAAVDVERGALATADGRANWYGQHGGQGGGASQSQKLACRMI